MIFHVIFAATLVGILVHLWVSRSTGQSASRVVEVSLLYLLSVQWGFGAAITAIPHIVVPDQVAGFIGWEPGSPFQVELGFGSLGTSLVGILYDGLNTQRGGVANLYLDGERLPHTSEGIDEPFTWDLDQGAIRLGVNYVGLYDELSLFSRALTDDEVRALHALEGGVAALHR